MTIDRSMSVMSDMSLTGALVIGTSDVTKEALYRRITCESGALYYSESYGLGLTSLIGTNVSPSALRGLILDQCNEDERIQDADVIVTRGADGEYTIGIQAETKDGPFDLTLSVTQAAGVVVL